ncbi:MAG: hypothetical protein K2Y35_01475 [Burkholderiales bacterium]|nr:hypothetical protein [Burkholderiales bacterium]
MIPRKIHYCWFGGGQKGELADRCMASWRRILPGFEVVEWNERNSDLSSRYAQEAMRQKRYSKVANLVRLAALNEHGGVYFDTDVEVVRPIDALMRHDCFAGFQLVNKSDEWVNNAILGGIRGHQFFADCIEYTHRHFESTGELPLSPFVTTAVLKAYGLEQYGRQTVNGVHLYEREAFYPYSWEERYRPEVVTMNTYCVHHWEKSWVKSPWSPEVAWGRLRRFLGRRVSK